VIAAAGTGSPLGGLAVMIAFWAGTVPILLALGLGVQLLAPRLARRLPAITALALVAVGLALVFGRIERIGLANRQATDSRPGTVAESIDFVKSLDAEKAPCCAGPHEAPATPRATPSRQRVPSPAPDAGGSGPTRDPEKPPCCNGQARDSS